MRAIDTNVLIRYLVEDNPEQSQKALKAVRNHEIFVGTAVFMESAWVLRRVYGFSSSAICQALRAFAGMPQVTAENPTLLAEALDRTEGGMDFADALHLGTAIHCDSFLTFDRKFIRAAAGGPITVEEPQ